MPDISRRMLTETPRKLERDGCVSRGAAPSIPPRMDCELTDLGRSLVTRLAPLARWADEHRDAAGRARAACGALGR